MYQYPIVHALVHPYAPLLIILGLVIARLWFKGHLTRAARFALTIPYLLLLFISLPAVSHLALLTLERPFPPLDHRPKETQAIVVLGGYVDPPKPHRDHPILGQDSLCRCLHAAALFRDGEPCPVILSGGKADQASAGPTVAAAMRDFLVSQGIPSESILLEDQSRNTYENARQSARLLRERGLGRAILVTDAPSLIRAERAFRRQGIEVLPSGCRYRTAAEHPFAPAAFIPSVEAASDFSDAWHEWLGLAWYWLTDRI